MVSCTKYNAIDTGIANPHFDGDMYEYLESSSYNWDSIRVMVDRAGMENYFRTETFTFLGPTNHTIRRWLLANGGGVANPCKISDLTVENCQEFVKMHIIEGKKLLRDDVQRGAVNGAIPTGGRFERTLSGKEFFMWTYQEAYQGIQGVGAVHMKVQEGNSAASTVTKTAVWVQSGDIQPRNGVVQALTDSYVPNITLVKNP